MLVTVDPGSAYTGLSLMRTSGELEDALVDWKNVRMMPRETMSSLRVRVLPHLDAWRAAHGPLHAILSEEPPAAARRDTEHGYQAVIGSVQGWIGGIIVGHWIGIGGQPLGEGRVRPGGNDGWRESVLIEAARQGLMLKRPKRGGNHPPGKLKGTRGKPGRDPQRPGGFLLPYLGCTHILRCPSYQALSDAPDRCAKCEAPKTGKELADQVRDDWKRLACDVVKHVWPETFDEIVTDARSRAKTLQEDHRYAGVSDVCDAICIGIHGRAVLMSPAMTG